MKDKPEFGKRHVSPNRGDTQAAALDTKKLSHLCFLTSEWIVVIPNLHSQ